MQSAADCNLLLTHARELKKHKSFAKVYVNKWMTRDELGELKSVKEACVNLNKAAPLLADGKQQFIVASGRLMQRSNDGKLLPVKKESCESGNRSGSSNIPCDSIDQPAAMSKKRERRGSYGPRGVALQEAIAASLVNYDGTLRRNKDVVGKLAQRGLTTVDVSDDGKYVF